MVIKMYDICFYSGLPYCCGFCPEDEAPCEYMTRKKNGLQRGNLQTELGNKPGSEETPGINPGLSQNCE